MQIAKRLTNGWTPYQLNKNKYTCDDCGARLWVAPDGKSKYCNSVHCECGAIATDNTGGLPDCEQCHADKVAFA